MKEAMAIWTITVIASSWALICFWELQFGAGFVEIPSVTRFEGLSLLAAGGWGAFVAVVTGIMGWQIWD